MKDLSLEVGGDSGRARKDCDGPRGVAHRSVGFDASSQALPRDASSVCGYEMFPRSYEVADNAAG